MKDTSPYKLMLARNVRSYATFEVELTEEQAAALGAVTGIGEITEAQAELIRDLEESYPTVVEMESSDQPHYNVIYINRLPRRSQPE